MGGKCFNGNVMTDYRPIPCRMYAELELAVMHQLSLRLGWRLPGGERHLEPVRPLDLYTRNHEEFLVAEDMTGQRLEIRLDRIVGFASLSQDPTAFHGRRP